jgi:V/A-type H+-transporting ATPase subunit C
MIPEITSLVSGASGANPLALLAAVIGILFGLMVIIVNLKLVLDIAPYAYPNAKVRSMQSMLIGKKKLEELAELELLNIPGALEETEYVETSKAITEEVGIAAIEATVNQNLMETYIKIAGLLPGDAKIFFEKYLRHFEIEAIKTVLRGVYAGLAPEEIERGLPERHKEMLKDVVTSSNIPEAISKLEGSEFGSVLSQSLSDFVAKGSLLPLENALDMKFYKDLMEVLLTHPSPDSDVIKKRGPR